MSDERTATRGEIPATIGRYQIARALGFGAMGAVYKAFDPLIKRTLAIKTIRLDIPRNSPHYRAFIERFYHEARISGTLSHPNIVTLFDIGEENGLPFLAMEFVDGETLAELIDEGMRFKPERVIVLGARSLPRSTTPTARRRPPRHQTVEPHPVRRRQRQGDGLRDREARGRRDDAVGLAPGDAVVHVARAGDGGEARRPQRHLLPRRLRVRDALRRAALPGQRTSRRSSTSSFTSSRSSRRTSR